MIRTIADREHEKDPTFEEDLHGNNLSGENHGLDGEGPVLEGTAPNAFTLKAVHNRLEGLHDDDLREIPVLPQETRLEQGAVYIDLREPNPVEFRAPGGMIAGPENWYVPKKDVPYPIWNRLIGVGEGARVGEET